MTNFETESGASREELVQRVALMETMIAEGRQSTARFGWFFVMWGLVYFAAIGWSFYLPYKYWAWPVCGGLAILAGIAVRVRQKRAFGARANLRSRSIEAVWQGMGAAIILYVVAAIASHHAGNPAYVGAILFFIGLAHAISARILRWSVQGVVAAIWWVGGITVFFVTPDQSVVIFLVASFFGMICFGLYAMWLERRSAAALVQHHA
ncbi:MAG: hypothetical protein ABSG84_01340 [Acidobacteriaceae bacterium]|jgi:hypothetical protein